MCTGTVVKVLGQLLNGLKFLRSPTGSAVLEPPLSAQEAPALLLMEQQVAHVKRQYFSLATRTKAPVKSPEELMLAGRWAFGGMAQLQLAARTRAARLTATVANVRGQERPKSAQELNLARKLSGSMMTMLLTALPPQRPRSLYTLRLSGVEGLEDPASMCSVCKEGTRCVGNTLVREAPGVYRWHISHHKCERSKQIPSQEISAGAHTDPVLLDVLEQVCELQPSGCHRWSVGVPPIVSGWVTGDAPVGRPRGAGILLERTRACAVLDHRRCVGRTGVHLEPCGARRELRSAAHAVAARGVSRPRRGVDGYGDTHRSSHHHRVEKGAGGVRHAQRHPDVQ